MATNNAINTPQISAGGTITFNGAFTFAATLTGNTAVTFPTSGTLATTAAIPSNVNVTTATQAMVTNNSYTVNDASALVAFTLPSTAAVGDILEICGNSADGWSVAQNALQSIQLGSVTTTVGTGGSLASTHATDCIRLKCVVANTTWTLQAVVGNITYV